MNDSRKVSKKGSKQGKEIEAAGKPEESPGCPVRTGHHRKTVIREGL
jgi:hypothetical protein